MPVIHMNQSLMANRSGVSEASRYLKLQRRVMYREKDIDAYEANCLRQSTSEIVKESISSS